MGVEVKVGFDHFPKQGFMMGKEVMVCFNYDTGKTIKGRIVRDDCEDPYLTIISLEDKRYILSTECQFSSYLMRMGLLG